MFEVSNMNVLMRMAITVIALIMMSSVITIRYGYLILDNITNRNTLI